MPVRPDPWGLKLSNKLAEMAGKKYKDLQAKLPQTAVAVSEAIDALKTHVVSRFDPTIELHVHLGVDPQKSDQMVRGQVTLPSGSPAKKRIVVITEDINLQQSAKESGAVQVGGLDLIEQIAQAGTLDADLVVATPNIMPKIAKVARILGPKGLMPNPKTGTVNPEPSVVVREMMSGKTMFKMDQLGNLHEAIGKLSWEADKISANVTALLAALRSARPTASKGQFIRSAYLKTTHSPAVTLAI